MQRILYGGDVIQVIGIIAEYNPFHHGHRYQIEELRKQYPDAAIVTVMSGSFTQRGAPCILDKWTRACHAVAGGADLVLELPFVFACRSAQDFAHGGISLLSRLDIVSHLCFGTEAEELSPLIDVAQRIDVTSVQRRLHIYMDEGLSYAGALTRALTTDTLLSEEFLRAPNNILAIEYLRALRVLAPQIVPIAIRRKTAQHADMELNAGITSASSIRHALTVSPPPWAALNASLMPSVLDDLRAAHTRGLPQENALLALLRYVLLVTDSATLTEVYGIAEGIENRVMQNSTAQDYRDFLRNVATKRYPQSRIARLLVHLLLHLTKVQAKDFDMNGVSYIRPLAFNTRGRGLLRAMKARGRLPIITRTAELLSSEERGQSQSAFSPLQRMLAFDTRATELRLMTCPMPMDSKLRTDFIMSPQFLP